MSAEITPSPGPARIAAAVAGIVLAAALTACAPDGGGATPSGSASASSSATPSDGPSATSSPSPSASSTAAAVAIPTDCRAILTSAVLAELGDTPLNDPAMGPSGPQDDGSLVCIWRNPAADTTGLVTTISREARGPALDLLNGLADNDGFTCYTPDGGTRCEKTWENETYPVTDGRTLFWRDDILIDTMYSNLAPAGYTSSIVGAIWP